MESVKRKIEVGVAVGTAIKDSIDGSITAFADRHDLSRQLTSEVINLTRPPRVDVCTALAKELGGSPLEWAMLLWEALKPAPEQFPTEVAA